MHLSTVITGTGSYLPTITKANTDFGTQAFFSEVSQPMTTNQADLIEKFKKITGIEERRYASKELTTSDIAAIAAKGAVEDSGIDPETLDVIIVAHNFGNVIQGTIQSDAVPSLANRVKHHLQIKNPKCVAYDLLFGCPGWLQGVIQADAFFKAGMAKNALVVGAETLSRVIDQYDRDSMIFSDGAGAVVMQYKEDTAGILGCTAASHSLDEISYINMAKSYHPGSDEAIRYIKMKGRKVYEYALKFVPQAMKECLEISGVKIEDVKKIFIHQANEKMDQAIVDALYVMYGYSKAPIDIMPMTVHYLGNSSVATIPTLYDLVLHGKDAEHSLHKGDIIMFASVGAGMNINAACYRV
ncbi:ketoacyl-ACP synthase III [Panacibacter sp. DH6]|uniref:Ketoacyl-ACP synthase III n=1 Tax=Panacibacter microcysteis TaxID=2793269 RepID=A0A931MDT3_9BACT|nr:ketoacyl-ACP synthase III [Panacibacter microcysteis]MBG9378548.1 ketoacyl-ACP synthase III [Panacibacter microcysteis]